MSYKVSVVTEKDDDGYYAYCPELPGCQTQGDDLNEVVSNIKEAIELYLETLSAAEKKALEHKEIMTMTLEFQSVSDVCDRNREETGFLFHLSVLLSKLSQKPGFLVS